MEAGIRESDLFMDSGFCRRDGVSDFLQGHPYSVAGQKG
jgi:hypothetical protein